LTYSNFYDSIFLGNQINMSEQIGNVQELSTPPSSEELFALGQACLSATTEIDLLAEHHSLTPNPNNVGGLAIPFKSGEISTQPGMVYRQVGLEAVQDLAQSGIVRNGATARGESHRRWGHRVFWSEGKEGAFINTSGRAVMVAPKSATEAGWVTANQLHSIYTRAGSGELIDLMAGQPQK
jgi:hypothetical protein